LGEGAALAFFLAEQQREGFLLGASGEGEVFRAAMQPVVQQRAETSQPVGGQTLAFGFGSSGRLLRHARGSRAVPAIPRLPATDERIGKRRIGAVLFDKSCVRDAVGERAEPCRQMFV